jgi:hypothetical protein
MADAMQEVGAGMLAGRDHHAERDRVLHDLAPAWVKVAGKDAADAAVRGLHFLEPEAYLRPHERQALRRQQEHDRQALRDHQAARAAEYRAYLAEHAPHLLPQPRPMLRAVAMLVLWLALAAGGLLVGSGYVQCSRGSQPLAGPRSVRRGQGRGLRAEVPAIQPDRAQHVAGIRWPRRRSAEGMGKQKGLGVMGGKAAPWFEFDFGEDGGLKKFADEAAAREFAQVEFTFYQWISPYTNDQAFGSIAGFIFNGVHHTLFGLSNPAQYGPAPQFLNNQLANLYRSGLLPTTYSARGRFIADVLKRHNEKTALGCLAYITKHMGGVLTNADGARGVMLAFFREQGISDLGLQSAQNNLDKLTNQVHDKINDIQNFRRAQAGAYTQLLRKQLRRNNVQRRWDTRKLRIALREQDKDFNKSVAEFNEIKATYQEFMKLKAPVDYWREKAEQHKSASKGYRGLLIKYGKIIAPALLLLLLCMAFASYYAADPAKPIASQFVFAAIGVLITTVAFWAARIVVRLYMSEHHLAIDAEERATMAMTYLALIERGAADEKDRALVLAPLFRPTSDGIIKDDAAPEFSPAAIASRYLTPR